LLLYIATPSVIRHSRLLNSGGEAIDLYGYWDVKSPSGVRVRAYIDDRRDPIELVGLVSGKVGSSQWDEARHDLETIGLHSNGPYVKRSPTTQSYMPDLPEKSELFAVKGGDPANVTQVLLLPPQEPKEKPLFSLPRLPVLVQNQDQGYEIGTLDDDDEPTLPISSTQGAQLVVAAPSASESTLGSDAGITLKLRTGEPA